MSGSPSRPKFSRTVRYVAMSSTRAPAWRRSSGSVSRAMSARGSRMRAPARLPSASIALATASDRFSEGTASTWRWKRVSRSAVGGPMAHSFGPLRSRMSRDCAMNRSMKWSTPFALVKTIQSKLPTRSMTSSSSTKSVSRPMRMDGARIGRAPRSASRSTKAPACSRERVTTMRCPNSGRSSNQRRCSRRPTVGPTTSTAG